VLPSEGGHSNLAATDPLEMEVLGFPDPSVSVFVGLGKPYCPDRGLVNLYPGGFCPGVGAPRLRVDEPSDITFAGRADDRRPDLPI